LSPRDTGYNLCVSGTDSNHLPRREFPFELKRARPGDHLGPYELVREVARGGQGVVFEALHTALGTRVALKILLGSNPRAAGRFSQEAQVLARLNHPNLTLVTDMGQLGGLTFLCMEYLEGESLEEHVKRSGLPNAVWIAETLAPVARALQYCHDHGVVHRDIKPANVVLEAESGRPVVIDFGLIKRDAEAFPLPGDANAEQLSRTGETKGTPAYMAPEQVDPSFGVEGSHSDVYALGATLFFLLTGHAPYEAATAYNIFARLISDAPPPDPAAIRSSGAPALEALCQAALSKTPTERPSSAAAFGAALEASLVEQGRSTSRPWALAALAAAALVTPIALLAGPQEDPLAQSPLSSVESTATTPPAPSTRRPSPGAPAKYPGFSFLRQATFSCGEQTQSLPVYRCEVFARALGLKPGQADPACEFVELPAGRFHMGSPPGEFERRAELEQQHEVSVPAFLIARTEICQAVWAAVMGANPARRRAPRNPVESVSWDDVAGPDGFLARTKIPGVRLPSEAEWEYAARGKSTTPFAFGSSLDPDQANYKSEVSYGRGRVAKWRNGLTPVGSFPPNAFGVHDAHGSVWEWVEDSHGPYATAPVDGSARSEANAVRRVNRGGSWASDPAACRSANRNRLPPKKRSPLLGFRVAR
jgi:formylglycine-generating enzyme required for sulfatase activity/serine/threonine protein kinase